MLRFLFRLFFTVMLWVLGRLLRPRSGRSNGRGGPSPGADPPGAAPRTRRTGAQPPPIDRSDVTDVPFTEIQPPSSERAPDAAGRT